MIVRKLFLELKLGFVALFAPQVRAADLHRGEILRNLSYQKLATIKMIFQRVRETKKREETEFQLEKQLEACWRYPVVMLMIRLG